MNEEIELVNNFNHMRFMAELNAYSKLSLERKLTDTEYNRMMELKEIMFGE